MDKITLLESADKIGRVSENSIEEYVDKTALLEAKMNQVMLSREDILELIGGGKNIRMMKDNHNSHMQFISAILQTPNSETLVDRFLWEFRAYMSRGFISNYWSAEVNTWIKILKENISKKSVNEILSIYDWFSVNIPLFTIAADEKLKNVNIG